MRQGPRERCALTQAERRVSAPRRRPNRGFDNLLAPASAIYRCEGRLEGGDTGFKTLGSRGMSGNSK